MTRTSKFVKEMLDWAANHSEDADSAFFLQSYADALQRRKAESKRWKLISKAFEYYSSRHTADDYLSGIEPK